MTKKKRKIILIDTNIYGWALKKKQVNELLNTLAKSKMTECLGFEIIRDELKSTSNHGVRWSLLNKYTSTIKGEIKLSKSIVTLAKEYYKKFRERKLKIDEEDCLIVASASLAGVHFIITDNRKTMANKKAIEIYKEINLKRKIRTPRFLSSNEAIELFS